MSTLPVPSENPPTIQRLLLFADHVSTWAGKASSWLILVLTAGVCLEVVKRYLLNAPTAWSFDADYMLYGVLFMMCGAYTLAQDGHVRGDFLYSSMKPRLQASLDLALYLVFFLPGIAALVYSGIDYAHDSWLIREHVSDTANGPAVYPFKAVIPVAGALVLLQGLAEILRCVVCLRTGQWPARLKDAEEIDVVEEQLAHSEYVDEESRRMASEGARDIHEAAVQRGMGDRAEKTARDGDKT
jgi:TRAP-type mannitol/chloroaromatic compound transport system permease small subunit